MMSSTTNPHTLLLNGIEVEFPFKPYNEQLEYMKCVIESLQYGKNAILESPTGTGKTLCLLCATLAWRRAEIKKRTEKLNEAVGTEPDYPLGWGNNDEVPGQENPQMPNVPRIVYASRTHSQLAQVVKELKRTSYAKDTKISILGSRNQMCIHPEVSKQTNNVAMIHSCRNKVNKRLCHFYNNVEAVRKSGSFTNEVLDIEELVELGKIRNACPYYAAREQSKESDCGIIFTPYNYLLDRKSRKSNNLEVSGNIIIFDEAHNLEQICEESASFDLTSVDIAKCDTEMGDLLKAAIKLSETGILPDGYEAGESSALSEFSLEELALLKTLFVKLEKKLNDVPLDNNKKRLSKPGRYMFEFIAPLNISFSTHEAVIDLVDRVVAYLSTLSNSFQTRGTALQKFSEVLKVIFSAAAGDNPALPSTLVNSHCATNIMMDELSKFYRVNIREEEKRQTTKNVWTSNSATTSTASTQRVLSYWCFSPGYAMRDLIAAGVKNLILTSGTLSPIQSFTCELQVDFPITLQNAHVIDDHQVFVATVKKTLTRRRLESTYKTRNDYQLAEDIGNLLVRIAEISPGGLLVFFPSYVSMEGYIKRWEEMGQDFMRKIGLRKPCTIESKSKNSLNKLMEQFYSDVSQPQGASFFAICRGKVSEGLDFADNNGRTVVIIGLPYPPAKDPRVNEKMDFLQALRAAGGEKVIDGQKWYRLQAIRAVNQAIGRIIRHRYDYGAIMLLDYRYADHNNFSELPKWIRPRVVEFDDAEKSLRRLKSFFCSIREKEKVRLRSITSEGKEKVSSTSANKSLSAGASKSENIFFGVQRNISNATSPYFTQSTNPAMKKNKTFLTIPKANEPANHIPPSVVANLASRPQSNHTGSCHGCPETSKKRQIEDDINPNLVPIKNTRKKPRQLSIFDALNNSKHEQANPLRETASERDVSATNLSREALIRDKMLDDQRRGSNKKKIRIIPNKSQTSVNKPVINVTGISDALVCSNDDALWDEKTLIYGAAEIFRLSAQEAVKPGLYSNFKKLLMKLPTLKVSAIVSELLELFIQNENSKIIFRAFVRFLRDPIKVEEFSVKCMEITGKRPLGY